MAGPDRGARRRRRLGRARGRIRGGRAGAAVAGCRSSPTPARPARAGTTERRWTSCSSGCPGRARAPSAAAWRRVTARRSSTSTTRSSATTGRSIPELFASEGEAAFRALEREAVAALGPPDPSPELRRVISPGGGAIVDPRNRWALYRGRLAGVARRAHRGPRPAPASLAQRAAAHPGRRPDEPDPPARRGPRAVLRGRGPRQRRRRGRRRGRGGRGARRGRRADAARPSSARPRRSATS